MQGINAEFMGNAEGGGRLTVFPVDTAENNRIDLARPNSGPADGNLACRDSQVAGFHRIGGMSHMGNAQFFLDQVQW